MDIKNIIDKILLKYEEIPEERKAEIRDKILKGILKVAEKKISKRDTGGK